MARFRTCAINWPGKRVSLSDIGGNVSLHGARVSFEIKFLRTIQLELWRGEIHQGNLGVLVIGHKPSNWIDFFETCM